MLTLLLDTLCVADGRLKGPVNHGETNPNSFVMVMSSIELAQSFYFVIWYYQLNKGLFLLW